MGSRAEPSPLGDPVPATLQGYFDAVERGDGELLSQLCADDVVHAVPHRGALETEPRLETTGIGALRDLVARSRRPGPRRLSLCVVDGSTCLVEGLVSGSESGGHVSFAVAATLDADRLLTRLVEHRTTAPIVPSPRDLAGEATTGDARIALMAYFEALDHGHFELAAASFSPSVLYSHPPYKHTGIEAARRLDIVGRSNLLATFRRRGRQSFGHRILAFGQRGRHAMLEGVVEGLPGGGNGSFVSSATLDDDGLIGRYASFYFEPAVLPA